MRDDLRNQRPAARSQFNLVRTGGLPLMAATAVWSKAVLWIWVSLISALAYSA